MIGVDRGHNHRHDGDMDSGNPTLFGDEDTAQRDRRNRIYCLAALLAAYRAERAWSVEQAALHAGIGHMTWRRAESGVESRSKTYAAMDGLFGLPPGTVKAATNDDQLMVDLARALGVHVPEQYDPTTWVRSYARGAAAPMPPWVESSLGGLSASARGTTAAPHPDTLRSLAELAHHVPANPPTDLQLATALVERLDARGDDPDIQAAVTAILKAMPALIGTTVRDAERDIQAQPSDRIPAGV